MFEEIVKRLANESVYAELFPVAEKIWSTVFTANANNIVYSTKKTPDISGGCREFRMLMSKHGFSTPKNDDDLYNLIIRPLMQFKINRAV